MKIAIIQLRRIGDLIIVTTAIKMIKQKFPNAKIYFIVSPSNYFVLNNNPEIEDILIFDKNPLKLLPFLIKLKSLNFDFYIDVKDHYSTESNILAFLVNAKTKIGFNSDTHKHNFDIGIPSAEQNINLHFIQRINNALKPLGIDFSNDFQNIQNLPKPLIYLTVHSHTFVNNFLTNNKIKQFCLINISASSPSRTWSKTKWLNFINQLLASTAEQQFLLISSPQDIDIANEIMDNINLNQINSNLFIHFSPSPFEIICALISRANLLISPDTSLIHIAAAFDIPVIALTNNIPWNITKFEPLSTYSNIIFPKNINEIVENIEIEQVLEAYNNFKNKA